MFMVGCYRMLYSVSYCYVKIGEEQVVILIECILYIRSRRWERVKISSILIHPSTLALTFALTLAILYPNDDSENFRFNISSQAFIHAHACTNHHIISFPPISHTSLVSPFSPLFMSIFENFHRQYPVPIYIPQFCPIQSFVW